MKGEGEEDLGNHKNSAPRGPSPSGSSLQPRWEEGQEVIPTFFSTMNTRYSVLSKTPRLETFRKIRPGAPFRDGVFGRDRDSGQPKFPCYCSPCLKLWARRHWTVRVYSVNKFWLVLKIDLWKMRFSRDCFIIEKQSLGLMCETRHMVCPVQGQLFS